MEEKVEKDRNKKETEEGSISFTTQSFFASAPCSPRAVQAQPWETRPGNISLGKVCHPFPASCGHFSKPIFMSMFWFCLVFPDKLRAGGAPYRAGSLQPLGQGGINSQPQENTGGSGIRLQRVPQAGSIPAPHASARSLLPSGASKDQQVERILLKPNNP